MHNPIINFRIEPQDHDNLSSMRDVHISVRLPTDKHGFELYQAVQAYLATQMVSPGTPVTLPPDYAPRPAVAPQPAPVQASIDETVHPPLEGKAASHPHVRLNGAAKKKASDSGPTSASDTAVASAAGSVPSFAEKPATPEQSTQQDTGTNFVADAFTAHEVSKLNTFREVLDYVMAKGAKDADAIVAALEKVRDHSDPVKRVPDLKDRVERSLVVLAEQARK